MLSTLCSRLSSPSGSGGGRSRSGEERGAAADEGDKEEVGGSNSAGLAKPMAVLLAWNYGAAALTLPLLVSAAMAVMS